MEFPAWLAVMEQVPAAWIVTVEAATVQTGTLVEVKLTGSPELADADIPKGADVAETSLNTPNVIVCDPRFTAKIPATVVAGR